MVTTLILATSMSLNLDDFPSSALLMREIREPERGGYFVQMKKVRTFLSSFHALPESCRTDLVTTWITDNLVRHDQEFRRRKKLFEENDRRIVPSLQPRESFATDFAKLDVLLLPYRNRTTFHRRLAIIEIYNIDSRNLKQQVPPNNERTPGWVWFKSGPPPDPILPSFDECFSKETKAWVDAVLQRAEWWDVPSLGFHRTREILEKRGFYN